MSGKHSELTPAGEIHVAKGFTEASIETALTKNAAGATEWAAISGLGGTGLTGSAGPAGSSLSLRKTTARVAASAAGTLASDFENGDTVNGIVLNTSDILLLPLQTNQVENGLYSVNASGAPTRVSGMSAATSLSPGDYLWVEEGTTSAGKRYQISDASVVGVDNLIFSILEDIKDLPPQSITSNIDVTGAQANIVPNSTIGEGSGTAHTINWNDSNTQLIDLQDFSGDVTLTLDNPEDGAVYSLIIIQGSVARNVVWPAIVEWPGSTAPTITTTDNKADVINMLYSDTFTKYFATFNQNFGTT